MTSMDMALEALKQVIRAQVIDDLLETLVDTEWSAAEHNADDVPALIKAMTQKGFGNARKAFFVLSALNWLIDKGVIVAVAPGRDLVIDKAGAVDRGDKWHVETREWVLNPRDHIGFDQGALRLWDTHLEYDPEDASDETYEADSGEPASLPRPIERMSGLERLTRENERLSKEVSSLSYELRHAKRKLGAANP